MTPRAHAEDGSALVLALVFLSLFGVLIAAVLSFADASLRTTPAVRERITLRYGAEAAVESAIADVRGSLSAGVAGWDTTCFSLPADALALPSSVAVRCTGAAGSGAVSGGGAAPNRPAQSVLTLSAHAGEGVVQTSNATVVVAGDVYSRTRVANTAANAVTDVRGRVVAPVCAGTITALVDDCGTAPGALAADPAWQPLAPDPPAYATVPPCTATGVVAFTPGTYTDAAALRAMTSGTSACAGSVFWFRPGVYYFDFTDAGSHEWVVDDPNAVVVGGTPDGWDPASGTRPAVPLGTACARDQAGVQLVLGGDSRLLVRNGGIELCAQPSATAQQIAVYGVRTGQSPPAPATAAATAAAAQSGTWTSAASGAAVDGATAAATVANAASAALAVSGFGSPVPAGARVTSATLRVTHRLSAGSAGSVAAVVRAGDGATTSYAVPECTTLCAVDIDVTGTLATPAKAAGVSVVYTATASRNKTLTASLDGAVLVMEYDLPRYRATSGCAAATPYSPGQPSTCAVLRGIGNRSIVVVHGTVYAPLAALDLSMTNDAVEVVDRGVVVRHLQIGFTPSASYAGAFISVPGDPAVRADRVVLFEAAVAGEPRLRARVRFDDAGGAQPGRGVEIESWSVLR